MVYNVIPANLFNVTLSEIMGTKTKKYVVEPGKRKLISEDRVWCNINPYKLSKAASEKMPYQFRFYIGDEIFSYSVDSALLEEKFKEKEVRIKHNKSGDMWDFFVDWTSGKVYRTKSPYDIQEVCSIEPSQGEEIPIRKETPYEKQEEPRRRNKGEIIRYVGAEKLNEVIDELKIDLVQLVAKTAIWAPREAHEKAGRGANNPHVRRGRPNEEPVEGIRFDSNNYPNSQMKAMARRYYGIMPEGYEVCHVCDKTCYDERYHTCFANLVLLPRGVAALSDHNELIKQVLQYRAYELYDWYPEDLFPKPEKPSVYPENWINHREV